MILSVSSHYPKPSSLAGYPEKPVQREQHSGYPDRATAHSICGPRRGTAAGCAGPGGPAHPPATSARAPARRGRVWVPGDPSAHTVEAMVTRLMVCIL